MKLLPILLPALFFMQAVSGADDSTVKLDKTTVVAVANKQARPVIEVVGAVSIISAKDIADTNSENMADALRYQSNIHMEDAGTRFGSSGINIRGIGDNRVALEVDGIKNAKQFSIGSYSNAPAQFPEIDLIKNIEILNGPASTLYGSDAIGGIVSINTWNPEDLTAQSDNNRFYKIRLGYDSKTHGRVISTLSAWNNKKFGSILAFTQRDGKGLITHDSLHDKRDFSDWEQQTLFTKFVFNTNHNNILKFSFNGSQKQNFTQINSFIGQERFARTSEILADDDYDNYKLAFDYDFMINNSMFDDGIIRSYYASTKIQQDTNERRTARDGTSLLQFRRFQYQQNNLGLGLNLYKTYQTDFATHTIIYGAEYSSADIKVLRDGLQTDLTTGISTPNIIGEVFPRRDFPNSKINELGIFILNEINLENSNWVIIPAIRFDYYDLSPTRDSIFDANDSNIEITTINAADISPKLGALYEINDNANIFAQYVHGFRAPPFDDVNIGLYNPIFRVRAIANPDLRSETSNGLEIGYRYFGEKNNLNLSLFYTKYHNFIESRTVVGVDSDTDFIIFQSRNVKDAEIYGIELSHSFAINKYLSSFASLAWTTGDNKTTNQPLNSIAPAKAVSSLSWASANNLWDIELYSTFVAAKNRIDETDPRDNFFKPAGYAVFDVFIKRKITDRQNIRIGFFNIANKKYWDWQQVRNFAADEPIIDSLSKPSRSVSLSYTIELY